MTINFSAERAEMEADLLASEAQYRELVQATLSIIHRGELCGPPTQQMREINDQRRLALRKCNRIFSQLQGVA
jgi:hypothetical protein